jgi:hypothetical protein
MFGLSDKTQVLENSPIATATGVDSAAHPVPLLQSQQLMPTSPVTDPAHAASVHSLGTSLPGTDQLAKSTVNLENAYIPSDPPHMTDEGASMSKPSAASLMNGGYSDDLIKIKQQALTSLAPLVDHLDQTPEEKFKTTMMLIQASDNPDLVPEAYDAANKISDEKARAQALLDVVNEINYFTQHSLNVTGQKPAF